MVVHVRDDQRKTTSPPHWNNPTGNICAGLYFSLAISRHYRLRDRRDIAEEAVP
jgi:hypothetical protein